MKQKAATDKNIQQQSQQTTQQPQQTTQQLNKDLENNL
jgi:hypothetical protein